MNESPLYENAPIGIGTRISFTCSQNPKNTTITIEIKKSKIL